MDSQLAAVLANGEAAVMTRAHIPERADKSVEMLPFTDTQDMPMDLSQKSSCSLAPDSQPLCLKLTPSCSNQAKQLYWTETPDMGEDNTDALEIVAEVTGVHEPVLPNTDSVNTPCMDSLASGLTACLSEQIGVTFGCGSNDLSDYPTVNMVTIKEEIEEVFIGEAEGYSEDCSDSPVSLNEINTEDKDTAGDGANGTDTQSAVVVAADTDKVSVDNITSVKTELEDGAVDSCGFTAKDASAAERQTPALEENISSFTEKVTGVDKQAQLNSGSSSDSSELPRTGSSERKVKERKGTKSRKERASSPVVPAYSLRTRSQRRRELNREAEEELVKEENVCPSKKRKVAEKLQSSPSFSDSANMYQGMSEPKNKMGEGADLDKMEMGRELKCTMEMEESALDLRLSRMGARTDIKRRKGQFEGGSETMLVMEVDEIVQQEVKEEEEDALIPLREEEANISFDPLQWEHAPSSPSLLSPSTPPSSPPADPVPTGLLLIDDQGIPYMLTPDGQKVLQTEPRKPHKAFTVRPRPKSRQVKVEDSTAVPSPDVALSDQASPCTLPCPSSSVLPPCFTATPSSEPSVVSKTVPSSGTKSYTEAALLTQPSSSKPLSDLQAQPIRILANSSTNTPILLLPSSHPSLSSSKPVSNSGLVALSLPLSIAQKSPSTPLLLVLSPLTTPPAPSSSLPSSLAVSDPVTSSLPISQTPSPSSVCVPLSSVQTNHDSSLTSNPSFPVLNLDSSTLSTSVANSNSSTYTSPVDSSATSSKQSNPDPSPKVILPKRSPLHRLLKLDTPSDADTQIKPTNSLIPASLSPTETPQKISPPSTPNQQVQHSLKVALSGVSQPVSTSNISKAQISTDDPHCPSSNTPPPATIFPTNHPKNLSLSSSCPRRILYCQFCPRAFYYLSDLERHSITHSQSKPHVCPLCNKAFKRSSHLERHKHIHTGQRNFICPICSKRFREAGELLRHQRVHTGEKPFQCSQCHMRFAERNTLRRHAKRKHQDQRGLGGQEDGCYVTDGMQGEQEDSAEWYSCTVPDLDSESEIDKE